ncbi:hypothetical protein ACG873_08215 [Mesorhizobium sp. AaZ16]
MKLALSSTTLHPRKITAISTFSDDLRRHSTPAAEAMIGLQVQRDAQDDAVIVVRKCHKFRTPSLPDKHGASVARTQARSGPVPGRGAG